MANAMVKMKFWKKITNRTVLPSLLLISVSTTWFAIFLMLGFRGEVAVIEPIRWIRITEVIVSGLILVYGIYIFIVNLRKD